jgi:hypothetical protein
VKIRASTSTHKKVIVLLADRSELRAYVNPANLGTAESVDFLTQDGEHRPIALDAIRSIYFVRDFDAPYELQRKAFLSRPKLDGLWVRLKFRDAETVEGVVTNDLLSLLDRGVQITPPDLHGNTLRIFIPRPALTEMTVLGVTGVARRKSAAAAAAAAAQPKLFED